MLSGRGKVISGRLSVGLPSAGCRVSRIPAKAGIARLQGEAVGLR
ncbi:hypothetical protein [Xenorhabdus szentirmaii]|nr:hypothetical protein [Xenorhabdus szentirmaii]